MCLHVPVSLSHIPRSAYLKEQRSYAAIAFSFELLQLRQILYSYLIIKKKMRYGSQEDQPRCDDKGPVSH